ncbi:hypothetical protein [Paenibacillus sp. GCM10027626]|uniref:hypothetical protein n=1 Tax=Paenibacillus sp. GCM10027626 TaxID=3273411 RepID=UPI0036393B3B
MTMALWLEAGFLVAFIVLVAGVLLWLRAANNKLARLTAAAAVLEQRIQDAGDQLTAITVPAAEAVQTVRKQLDYAMPVFDAAKRCGRSADELAAAVSKISAAISNSAARYVEQGGGKYGSQITEALEIAEAGFAAWHFWQTKRKEYQRSSACSGYDEGHDTNQ